MANSTTLPYRMVVQASGLLFAVDGWASSCLWCPTPSHHHPCRWRSSGTGAIGGAIGASLGLLVLTAIAITQQWTLTIEPAVLPAGPLIGALTGAIAGTLPANRARHIEPAEALRR